MATDYFNQVTGTNDYERQSWRDSHNGGRAAGDWSGLNNVRLDAERDAFQGATWSGSSSQFGALEYAKMGGSRPSAPTPSVNPSPTAYPGSESPGAGSSASVVTSPEAAATQRPNAPAGGSGPGTGRLETVPEGGPRRTVSGLTVLPMDQPSALMPVYVAGHRMSTDRGFSNMADVEDRFGDAEFLTPSWFYTWAVAGADTYRTSADFIERTSNEFNERHDIQPGLRGGDGWSTLSDAFGRQAQNFERQLHESLYPDRPFVGGGF